MKQQSRVNTNVIILASLVAVMGTIACDGEPEPETYELRAVEPGVSDLLVEEFERPDAVPEGRSTMEIYWDESDHALYVFPASEVSSEEVEAISEELAQELGIATNPQQLKPVCCKAVCLQGACVIPGVADGTCTCMCVNEYPFCSPFPLE